LFDNRRQGNPNQQVVQSPSSQSPQPFEEAEKEEVNQTQNQNQRRSIED